MLKKFYLNKKILITGHTGFKGSWLCLVLVSMGAKVYGISDNVDKNHLIFRIFKLSKKVKSFYCDINNYKKISEIINKKVKPEIIFHLAAQSLVKKSYIIPRKTFLTNTVGVLNILDACRNCNSVKSILIVTSDKCYKNYESNKGYSEKDELGGIDPYSASKAAAENIFYSYNQSFFIEKNKLGLASTRAGNVIGGGDWSEDRIIPDFIKSIKFKNKFIIRNPKSTRPWQHIFDLLNGYLILAKKIFNNNRYNGSWNFGPNKKNSVKVIELINGLKKSLNFDKEVYVKQIKNKETVNLFLDAKKSRKQLAWKNKLDINDSLKLTGEWYKTYLLKKNSDLYLISIQQIKKYFKI